MLPNIRPAKKLGNLKCPECAVIMTLFSCRNVIIDKCHRCSGIWFDDREIGEFRQGLDETVLANVEIIHKPAEEDETLRIYTCPRCDVALEVAPYFYKSKVQTHRCLECKGLWLPAAEVVNLVDVAKINQELSENRAQIVRELKKMDESKKRTEQLNRLGKNLKKRVSYFSLLWRLGLIVPLYDNNPRVLKPIVTNTLIALNVGVFLMAMLWFPNTDSYQALGVIPNHWQYGTLLTSLFCHAGLLHLLGNMFFLWTFGASIECTIGRIRFLMLYFVAGLASSAAHITMYEHSHIPLVGASGAIAGLMGCYVVLLPQINIKTLVISVIFDIPAWVYLISWFLMQLLYASLLSHDHSTGIAWWSHIAGFVVGATAGALFKKFKRS